MGWSSSDLGEGDPVSLNYMRGIIDQFFMTFLYVLVVYSIGLTSFKLIDLIPDGIMRWLTSDVRSWGTSDIADDLLYQMDDKMGQQTVNMVFRLSSTVEGVYGAAAQWGVRAERQNAAEAAQKAAAQKEAAQKETPQKAPAKKEETTDPVPPPKK